MMKYLILTLYGAGVIGAMVANYLAVTSFLRPVYGASAVLIGLVFDAAWLGASCSWIILGRRDRWTKAGLVGGVVAATAIQFWIGWSEAGELGRSVVAAGDGQNYYMAALAILRHALMPAIGLFCVHALGRDWPLLSAEEETTVGVGGPTTVNMTTPAAVDMVAMVSAAVDRIAVAVAAQTTVLDELVDTVVTMTTTATALASGGHTHVDGRPPLATRPRSLAKVTTVADSAVAAAIAAGIPRTTARRWATNGDPRLDPYQPATAANGRAPHP